MTTETTTSGNPDIKPGDTVMLKSGGPIMSVSSVGQGEAWCWWANKECAITKMLIPLMCLKRPEPWDYFGMQ